MRNYTHVEVLLWISLSIQVIAELPVVKLQGRHLNASSASFYLALCEDHRVHDSCFRFIILNQTGLWWFSFYLKEFLRSHVSNHHWIRVLVVAVYIVIREQVCVIIAQSLQIFLVVSLIASLKRAPRRISLREHTSCWRPISTASVTIQESFSLNSRVRSECFDLICWSICQLSQIILFWSKWRGDVIDLVIWFKCVPHWFFRWFLSHY
jgi:hypothetical protein